MKTTTHNFETIGVIRGKFGEDHIYINIISENNSQPEQY